MDVREIKFLNAWNAIPGVGAMTLRAVHRRFGSFADAWQAHDSLYASAELTPQVLAAIMAKKQSVDPDREMQKLARGDIWTMTEDDLDWPALLGEIPSPPLVLYGRGTRTALNRAPCVAIVGTRRPTPYGLEAAESMATRLCDAGVAIVSGLAMGIDTKAHATALEHKAVTIGVLGSGVDAASVFPPENRGLAERIASSGGAVISEYSPGTPAVKEHFPMRNRIIAGLSQGTLVVEARERSGALITARFALEQNREVMAVPGSIFSPTSQGPLALIREGACAVRTGDDILEALGIAYSGIADIIDKNLNPEDTALLELLATAHSVDEIKRKTGRATAAIMASLSLLELNGYIRNLGADTFQKM